MRNTITGAIEEGRPASNLPGRIDSKARVFAPDNIKPAHNASCRGCKALCGYKDDKMHDMWCWIFNRRLSCHSSLDNMPGKAYVTERCEECLTRFGAKPYHGY